MTSKEINFDKHTSYIGRNGQGIMTGLDIIETSDNSIMITPINTKGQSDAAIMEIPLEHIPNLIEFLFTLISIRRTEVIDHTSELGGRAYVKRDDNAKFEISIQDEGKTLKVFIT